MVKYKWSIYEWLRSSSQVIYYLVSAVRRKLDRVFLQGVHVETRHGHCWHEVGIGQHLMFLQKKVHKTAKLKTAIKKSLSANWKNVLIQSGCHLCWLGSEYPCPKPPEQEKTDKVYWPVVWTPAPTWSTPLPFWLHPLNWLRHDRLYPWKKFWWR